MPPLHATLRAVIASLLVVWVSACAPSPPESAVATVGKPAPDFGAVSLARSPVSLRQLRGHVVLLNVWSIWCPPCRAEVPVLEGLHRAHQAAGLEVVAIDTDPTVDEPTVRSFASTANLTYRIWLDPEQGVLDRYRAEGLPASYLIGRDGTLLWAHLGAIRRNDPGLEQVLRSTLVTPAPTRGDELT
jgi:cytochrome c biogenesis protein CcmG, thiol:disulfide interchange protein DsbE